MARPSAQARNSTGGERFQHRLSQGVAREHRSLCDGEPARASVCVEGGCGCHWDNCWSSCSAGHVVHWTRR